MSWLSSLGKHLGIRVDSHSLGNLIKDLSPAAALIPGVGPLAAAGIAAGASALGDLGRGKSPGIASALENAGLGYGASSLLGGLGSAAPGAQSAAGSVAPTAGGVAPPSTVTIGGVSLPAPSAAALPASSPASSSGFLSSALGRASNTAMADSQPVVGGAIPYGTLGPNDVAPASVPPSFLGRALSNLGSAGDWAEHHPNTVALGMNGLGSLATAGARNRLANTNADQAEYDLESQKRRNQYLSQYLNQYGGLGGNFTPAPNPWTGRTT